MRARYRHSARALFVRIGALAVIAMLPVAFSAWIDPAHLVTSRRAEVEIARALASGRNVTDFVNYDDRAIERSLVAMRPVRPEVLALGSSRMQPLPASAFPGRTFINAAMQGAVLDDLMAVYALYDTDARRPRQVLLNVDPWTESFEGYPAWGALAEERAALLRRIGIPVSPWRERMAMYVTTLRRLVAPEYFRLAVHSFRRHGTRGIPWVATDRAQNEEKTKLPNGTVVWSNLPADNSVGAARRFVVNELPTDSRFHRLDARVRGPGALEKLVRYMRAEGVSVTVVLAPFAPDVFDAFTRLPGHSVRAVESELRAMAARSGAAVVGSFDPRVAGTTTLDFFDEDHLRPDALARVVSAGR